MSALTLTPPPPRTALKELTSLGREAMKEVRAARRAPLWVGTIEGIFGYGMAVVADSATECHKALKAEYFRWKRMIERDTPEFPLTDSTFAEAFERFGGCIRKIKKGQVYYDGFGE